MSNQQIPARSTPSIPLRSPDATEAPCGICFGLDVEANYDSNGRFSRALKLCKIGEIQQSAADGCFGCAVIARGLVAAQAGELEPDTPVHIILHAGLPLRVEALGIDLEFFVPTDTPSPWPCIGQAAVVQDVLDPEGVAILIRTWLRRCQADHHVCQGSSQKTSGIGPRRLIHLIPENRLRLVEAAGVTDPYIALSYCWGKEGNYTTTLKTLNQNMEAIDADDLPKSMRDAIEVTRHLGVEYIWIDSICIIQNDVDGLDWRIESSKMDSIYEGSLLTLSATRSPSVLLGFLGQRENLGHIPDVTEKWAVESQNLCHAIPCKGPDGKLVEILVRNRIPHDAIIPEDADWSRYPLLSRGWTFQERLLSTRTVHFLPQEILWECRCDFWCECRSAEADQLWKTGEMRGSSFNLAMSDPGNTDLTLLWQSLVQQYSKRSLTVQYDRLPALSGIARRLQQASPAMGDYLAGLWEKDLMWHLVWQVDHKQLEALMPQSTSSSYPSQSQQQSLTGSFCDASPDARKPRKPSWSWVSTQWPVKWSAAGTQTLRSGMKTAEFISADCTCDPINPLGAVSHGELVLKASVISTELSTYHGDNWKLTRGRQLERSTSPQMIFIPDGTATELGLLAGDTIYCARILEYKKAGELVWVALGLRRLEPPAKEAEGYAQMIYRYLFGGGNAEVLSPVTHERQTGLLPQALEENGVNPAAIPFKLTDNLRPVHSGWVDEEAAEPLRCYRVGLVTGTGRTSSLSTFEGVTPQKIAII
ncbi:TOL [Fusarium albosuccineum]|uniref:TOL n=1 Tax=Fusarium albosuccineum TaxID=1237068 RepID=A0A8H4L6U5_9HYPO|nr:TOL [Fusarium albosuccineum]